MMASVALRNVAKAYSGNVQALRDLTLEVRDRELLVLLGPSGCGKSTVLRLIAGLEDATAGEVQIGKRTVNSVPPKDRNIAMVFQNYALYPHMTVYKNMAFGLQLRYGGGWLSRVWKRLSRPAEAAELAAKRREIRRQVEETARSLGIGSLLSRMPGQLSGGERQRVALGRAMVRQPAVFLFDEPLSNLDAKLRLETRRELKQLHRRLRATMIYVTHDQTEALTLGDRIAVLREGDLQQIGEPAEIYDAPKNLFVAGFVGSPPMNLCRGRLDATAGFEGCGWRIPAATSAPQFAAAIGRGREVVLGVRPADTVVRQCSESTTTGSTTTGSTTGADRSGLRVTGWVRLHESHGDTAYVHVGLSKPEEGHDATGFEWVCRTEPRGELRVGDRVEIEFDRPRMHVFDAETGFNLHAAEE